jgi:drug/metabolite transporter (DMT)-like permease
LTEEATYSSARRGAIRVLAGAAMISFAPVFVRLTSVPPTASAFYRTLIGGLMLLAVLRFRGERLWSGRSAFLALVAAGLWFALDLWAWHRSIWFVGPGLSTLLANFQVFCLALAGVIVFGERLRLELVVAIPMAFIGLAMIVGVDWNSLGSEYRWGIFFGLVTAVSYAAYILCLRRARLRALRVTVVGDLAVASLLSAVALLSVAMVEDVSLAVPSLRDGALLVGYALVAQVLGWLLITSSLKDVPASMVGLLLLLQPTLAFIWDVLIFDRGFGVTEVSGAVLALFAIYLGSRPDERRVSGQDRQGAR